jgi:DNA-binding transcriptional MerR regulator
MMAFFSFSGIPYRHNDFVAGSGKKPRGLKADTGICAGYNTGLIHRFSFCFRKIVTTCFIIGYRVYSRLRLFLRIFEFFRHGGEIMTYTVSQIAEKMGVTVYTLHYYDKEGLLPFVDRDRNGDRVFKDSDFRWLDTITVLKNTGMPIKQIRQYIEWVMEGDSTVVQRFECIKKQKKLVEQKLAELKNYAELLDYKEWYYETAAVAGTTAIHTNCKTPERIMPRIIK